MHACCYRPAANYLLAFTIFQAFLMILTCLLICYTEPDTLEDMLVKSGTIPRAIQPAAQHADMRRPEPPRGA